jgi:hypothetical protein
MPDLEEETKTSLVTYASFDAADESTADFNHKLNQYVWDNLPLTAAQKEEFRGLLLANEAEDIVCHPSKDEHIA